MPKFCKARPVLYAMHGKVEEELHRLVQEGILEPIQCRLGSANCASVEERQSRFVCVVTSS